MGQAAKRKGRAAMTRKTYCGNLLWQSGPTLLALDDSALPIFFYSTRVLDSARVRRGLRAVSPCALARAGCAAAGRRRKRVAAFEFPHRHAVALAEEFLRMVLAAESAALADCRDWQGRRRQELSQRFEPPFHYRLPGWGRPVFAEPEVQQTA